MYMRVVYGFQENQQIAAFGLEDLKDKNTLCRCIQGSKTRNNLQTKYLEVKKQEATYDSELSSLKRNSVPAMSLENEISKVRDG